MLREVRILYGGYANKIARVDLSGGDVEYSEIEEGLAEKYLGGRGLGVKYVLDNGVKHDPFSEDNLLALLVGPLTGTRTPMSGRLAAVTKSPLTGGIIDSHVGGYTGAALKWAGFDGLLFKGKADKPVYALVEGGKVELRDASALWGGDTHEATLSLKVKHGEDSKVLAIGQAGENLVHYACIIGDTGRAAGRGGAGAVMGSKNLKAVVIKGSSKNRPEPRDAKAFKEARERTMKLIVESQITGPGKGGLSVYGTAVLMNLINAQGALPVRNAQEVQFEHAEDISGETLADTLLTGRPTCDACAVGCKRFAEIKNGRFRGMTEGPEYESDWALGAMCGLGDLKAITYLNLLANKYGIDTIETGVAIATAMEATQAGLVKDGIKWGDAARMVKLLREIAYREGLGATLAEGAFKAAEVFGDTSIAMSVKGQGIPAYDPRGMKGLGLGYATSNRGACHLRAYTPASETLGVPSPTDPYTEEGKAELVKIFQDLHAATDSLDMCKFSAFAIGPGEYAALLSSYTGMDVDEEGFMRIGERIYCLERYFLNLLGYDEKDDTLPDRFLSTPVAKGPSKGQVVKLKPMLEEYYKLRGWEKGVVTKEKLRELGIT